MTQEVDLCKHYNKCGGCSIQHIPYQKQLEDKKENLLDIFLDKEIETDNFEGITASPDIFEYRNNMEFSFGDLEIGGELQLGMHPRGRRFDVVTVDGCLLVDNDFREILTTILQYCREQGFKKYHIKRRNGFLRNLVIRKGINTGEVIANLITTSQRNHDFSKLAEEIKTLDLKGKAVGFVQTINDNYSDQVSCDEMKIYFGRNYFYEKLMDKKFKVDSLSFFQTNTKGAEVLYKQAQEYIENAEDKIVYDLYCGAGTISQTIAEDAEHVYGIEIDESAVKNAEKNAAINGINNADYLAGDVLEVIDEIDKKANLIIIDPPRPGINPKALNKIAAKNADQILYISCNPKSLARDIKELEIHNYKLDKFKAVDMFPHTKHLEVVSLLSKKV